MNRNRQNRNILIGMLVVAVLVMTTGYAAFGSNLNIVGTATTKDWKVDITSISEGVASGTARNVDTPDFNATTASFNVVLVKPGDSMEYDITISNTGNINAVVDSIDVAGDTTATEGIKYTVTGVEQGTKLDAQSTNTVHVKVEWVGEQQNVENTTKSITVTVNYVQA